jgi:acetyltransferase-like isoleucine patch superfamily enzyme
MNKSNLPWIYSTPDNYNVFKNSNGYPYFIHKLATITPQTKIGNYTYIHGKSRLSGDKEIIIGNFCSIANDVRIQVGDEHNYKQISTFPFKEIIGLECLKYDEVRGDGVIIGNDVWIGEGVRILAGAVIGDGVVIGAGSVVRGNLNSYGVYAGNPISLRRMRCDESTVNKMNKLKWWEWDIDKIIKNSNFFSLSLFNLSKMTITEINNLIK